MLSNEKINSLIGIDESFKAPYRLKKVLDDKNDREKMFDSFLKEEHDLTFDWLTNYFQEEHSDRKNKKQDFTPSSIATIASNILGISSKNADICAGTGGLTIKRWVDSPDSSFYCEEFSDRALPFLLFNLAIRNVDAVIFHGDSLTREIKAIYKLKKSEKYSDINVSDSVEKIKVHTLISNPPYSLKWNPTKEMLSEERFKQFDVLAPKSKADYAFLLQGLSLLDDTGTMSIILPHGILFRGAAEGKIRKKLIELNLLDAVIGLPEKLFLATDIPTVILVLKKDRKRKDILFIDASKQFQKDKNHNILLEEHIDKIVEAFNARKDIDKFVHVANLTEIEENDYNLNIPRYIDTFEPEILPPLSQITKELTEIDSEIDETSKSVGKMLNELKGRTDEDDKELKALIDYWNSRYPQREEQLSLL